MPTEAQRKLLAVISEGREIRQQINIIRTFLLLINDTLLNELAKKKFVLDQSREVKSKKSLETFYSKEGKMTSEESKGKGPQYLLYLE
jgi:hypothetical protein